MSARHTTSTTTLACVVGIILIFAPNLSADSNLRREGRGDQVKYGVGHWSESLGLHRAVVRVTRQADAVGVHIPWRRRDLEPERKRILVVDASTDRQLENVLPVDIQREYGDLVFQPATAPGDYYIYYMPFEVQEGYGGYGGDYLPPESTADGAVVDEPLVRARRRTPGSQGRRHGHPQPGTSLRIRRAGLALRHDDDPMPDQFGDRPGHDLGTGIGIGLAGRIPPHQSPSARRTLRRR